MRLESRNPRKGLQVAPRESCLDRRLVAARIGDRPDHTRLPNSVEGSRHLEVGIDLAVVHHIHRLAVVAEDHPVRALQSTAVLRLLIGVRPGIDVLRKFRPFDARGLEKLYPQHQWPGRDQTLRAGVQDSVYRPEQIIVGAEVRRTPRNPIDRIVAVPFQHQAVSLS